MIGRRRHDLAALVLIAILAGSTVTAARAASPEPSPSAAPPLAVDASPVPEPEAVAAAFPASPTACASRVLAAMTLEERVGQLFMLGIGADLGLTERRLIEARHLGSVTFAAFVSGGVERIRRITDAIQAQTTSQAAHGVRFLVAANQEGGFVQALSGPGFSKIPSALAQGRLYPGRLKRQATAWGQQLAAAGVNLDLAPVADVVPAPWVDVNAPIGRLQRAFGPSPDVVERHVRAFIEGMHASRVLTAVKHFPGLGRVRGNTDFAARVHDRSTRRGDPFLRPFQVAVDAGVPFVMTSLASYGRIDGRTPAALSDVITAGMLRGDLAFDGVILSDDLSAAAVRGVPAQERAVRFIRAGGDMVISTRPREARAMATAIVQAAQADLAFSMRVDQSALRVLEVKESAGLIDCTD